MQWVRQGSINVGPIVKAFVEIRPGSRRATVSARAVVLGPLARLVSLSFPIPSEEATYIQIGREFVWRWQSAERCLRTRIRVRELKAVEGVDNYLCVTV